MATPHKIGPDRSTPPSKVDQVDAFTAAKYARARWQRFDKESNQSKGLHSIVPQLVKRTMRFLGLVVELLFTRPMRWQGVIRRWRNANPIH